ncbi:MAG: UDP-glucose 4-epimerase GalE [Reichenbachiella sp.]
MSSKERVLVTGGLGYIGAHTVVELQHSGYEVHVLDDLSNTTEEVKNRIKDITGLEVQFTMLDLKDNEGMAKFFQANSFDAVIHFAASKSVGESTAEPLMYYQNNIIGLVNVIDRMKISGIKNLVFSSSCTVYGQPDQLPVTEQTPLKPAESPYGNTKKIGEDILSDSAKAYDQFSAISLRYFNPIGAHESGLIGERPVGIPNNLMPYLMQVATGEREQLSVFGNDYDTPDGTAVRDYIHVVDLAKAHVLAVQRQLAGKQDASYEIFNLGSGDGYSVKNIIDSFEKVNGVKINYVIAPRRDGDIEKIYADNSFSENTLGWKPELSLDDMMSSAWKWQQILTQ